MSGFDHTIDVESLIHFLEEKGQNHRYYYHYTNWESLKCILSNQTFLLTRGNASLINDQHEAIMKGSYDVWMKTYIGSFAFGTHENMAMWGLYGLPWSDAVRIAIPRVKMNEWLKSIKTVFLWNDNQKEKQISGSTVSLTDIVYIGGTANNTILTHNDKNWSINNRLGLVDVSRQPQMTGYIKNYSWHYENEVRLRIELPYEVDAVKICIDIPSDVVDSFMITTGPNFIPKSQDYLFNSLIKSGRLKESSFNGLIKYRSVCDLCKHKEFLYNK